MREMQSYPTLSADPGAVEYFWHQLPYGVPGLACFAIGLVLLAFAVIGAYRDPARRPMLFGFGLTVLGFAALGLVQAFRAFVLDRELLILLSTICYPALMLFAPGMAHVTYELTFRRIRWLRLVIVGTWITFVVGMAGVLQNYAFEDQWLVYPFGQIPRVSPYVKVWAVFGALVGFAGYAAFWIHRRRHPDEYRKNRMIIINLALLITSIQSNLPALLGIPLYPLGNFGFVPLILMAYAVFRDDFLNLSDLLFKRNGLFYSLNLLLGITFLTLAASVEFFLSPEHLAGIHWQPYLLITFGSLIAVFTLGILVGGANPGARINQMGSLSLYLTGFLMLAVVIRSLGLDPLVSHRLEQMCYILFGLAPAVQFRFAFRAMNQPLPRYAFLIDAISVGVSAFALSPFLFVGYYSYDWGNIGAGGPAIQVFGAMGFVATAGVTVRWLQVRREAETPLGSWIALSVIINAILMLGNLPATQGVVFYPLGNLVILPTAMLAYAVLAHGGVVRESHAVKIGNRISLIVLLILPVFLYFSFRSLPATVPLADRVMFTALAGAPLMLFGYMVTFLLTRPLAAQLDRNYSELEDARAAAEASRDLLASSEQEVQRLNEFSRLINETADLNEVLQRIHRVLGREYNFDGVWVLAVDQKNKELVSMSTYGATADGRAFTENLRLPLSEETGSLVSTVRRKRPLYLSRMPVELDRMAPFDRKIVQHFNLKALLHVPLIINQEVIGIVCIASFEELTLKKADIERINRYCEQIAGALRTLALLKEVDKERQESDRLLLNILPQPVAKELKANGHVEPVLYESVSVMFTDIRGFTRYASEMAPEVLVGELDAVFEQFDEICERFGLEKLKTIGDAYMCGGGLPRTNATHPVDVCLAALEFQAFMEQVREIRLAANNEDFWQIRVGIHTGSVMAGVIGKNKFAYDIWGDAVNIASRMESNGEGGRINVSENTYLLVRSFFECTSRGEIEVKNRGRLQMYFVDRIRPELSDDDDGLVPNQKFQDLYIQKRGDLAVMDDRAGW